MRKLFFLAVMLLSVWCNAAEKNESLTPIISECLRKMDAIEKEFYDQLHAAKTTDDFVAVDDFLFSAKKCASTKYDNARILDYAGELSRYSYTQSGDDDFAKSAEKTYLKALEINTEQNEKILWHLVLLMRQKKDYVSASYYNNRLLAMKDNLKDPLPYLKMALLLSVDLNDWQNAHLAMEKIFARDKHFNQDIVLLWASVKTLCQLGDVNMARKMTLNAEENAKFSESEKQEIDHIKTFIQSCPIKQT